MPMDKAGPRSTSPFEAGFDGKADRQAIGRRAP